MFSSLRLCCDTYTSEVLPFLKKYFLGKLGSCKPNKIKFSKLWFLMTIKFHFIILFEAVLNFLFYPWYEVAVHFCSRIYHLFLSVLKSNSIIFRSAKSLMTLQKKAKSLMSCNSWSCCKQRRLWFWSIMWCRINSLI